MRQVVARKLLGFAKALMLVPLFVLPILLGCNQVSFMRRDDTRDLRTPTGPTPDAAALVRYLNANAQRIPAISCDDVDVRCWMGRQSVGLDAKVLCQKPRNFRLRGRFAGSPAVDIGSNEEEFWYWMSKNPDGPHVYHCSYRDISSQKVNLPFPFHPDLAVAALGLQEYDPNAKYTVKAKGKYLELTEETITLQGQPARKTTVFVATAVKAPQPQVVAHILEDQRGKVICKALIEQAQILEASEPALVPRVISFEWPAQEIRLKMTFRNLKPANFTSEQQGRYFSRNDLKQYGTVNLAQGNLQSSLEGRAGPFGPRR